MGKAGAETDIKTLKAAVQGLEVEPWLPAITPGTVEHWLWNEHYKSDEEFLFAIADVMHEEYKAIADAGLILQIDDPDLPDGWQMYPDMSVADYRKYAQLRVEALNHVLRDIPAEQIRFPTCWGSSPGRTQRHSVTAYHRLDPERQGGMLFDRGLESAPRARVDGVAGCQIARWQVADAGVVGHSST